jgi:hypothetical protein
LGHLMIQAREVNVVDYIYNKVGFIPTEAQVPILESKKRFILVAGGEQAGKSMIASKFLLARFLEINDAGLYWLVAADYERTRAEFEYLVDDFSQLGVLSQASKRVDPGKIVLADGTRIETKSAKDPRTLAMRAPDGIIGCEASQLDLETFYRMRGRCAPKRAWLFLSGTFEGSLGWYPQMHTAWSIPTEDEESFSLPSYTNVHLYPEGFDDPEIQRLKRDASDDFFLERIQGIPSPPHGLVFPEFRSNLHVGDVTWDIGTPIHIWMDPGYAGAYAIAVVQIQDDVIHVIDEIYERGLVTGEMIQMCQQRPWWKDVQYGVIDVAGYQHQAMAAPAEIWMKETGLYMNSQKVMINDGTERLKSFLKIDPVTNRPKVVINPKCTGILSEFGAAPNPFDGQTRVYRWKTDRDGNIVGNMPEDKNNHGIKALIYGIVDNYGYAYVQGRDSIRVKRW